MSSVRRAPPLPFARPPCWRDRPGAPALYLTTAAEQLLEHLAALKGTSPADQGIIAVLARAGAQMLMSGIEMDESR